MFQLRPVLIAKALSCQRGGQRLFEGLNLRLAPGDLVTLTGPDGSGKSTLLRILAGLTPVRSGEVQIEGLDDETDPRSVIHYHGHQEGLRDALTARGNLAFSTALAGERVAP